MSFGLALVRRAAAYLSPGLILMVFLPLLLFEAG